MSYWDTSTLGKLYLPEPDSADFAQKAAADPARETSRPLPIPCIIRRKGYFLSVPASLAGKSAC